MEYNFIIDDETRTEIELVKVAHREEQYYPKLVNTFVRQQYNASKVESIINNYLDDMTNVSHYNEFKALQEYRKECKAKAKELLGL